MWGSYCSSLRAKDQLRNRIWASPVLASLQYALFSKNSATEEHCQRIAIICLALGERLGFSPVQQDRLLLLGLFHDIGKLFIDDPILTKPGPLTAGEWAEIKRHPDLGCRIARSVYELAPIADCILSHHERWDGSGYPQGLRGYSIPFFARLLAVADAYDAMTQPRPYKAAVSHSQAIAEIQRCKGTQFDPDIVDVFVRVMD